MVDQVLIFEGRQVPSYRKLVLRAGLRLEVLGLKRRGRSCYAIIKQEFGLKGSKASVLEQFTAKLKADGILQDMKPTHNGRYWE